MAFQVETHDITGNLTGEITLAYAPVSPTEVAVDPIGGPAQVYGEDFTVSGETLTWNIVGSDILQVVTEGVSIGYNTTVRIMYER